MTQPRCGAKEENDRAGRDRYATLFEDRLHPNLKERDKAPVGHGVLVWFEVDDFDAAVERARKLRATVVEEPHVNPAPQHREMWLRDPDGYYVVLASRDGEAK